MSCLMDTAVLKYPKVAVMLLMVQILIKVTMRMLNNRTGVKKEANEMTVDEWRKLEEETIQALKVLSTFLFGSRANSEER